MALEEMLESDMVLDAGLLSKGNALSEIELHRERYAGAGPG